MSSPSTPSSAVASAKEVSKTPFGPVDRQKSAWLAASAVVMGAEVFLPLEGLVDLDEERARLAREAGKLLGDLENTKKKLRNQDFLAKARPDVVEKERTRLAGLEETLDKLKRAQESLRAVQS